MNDVQRLVEAWVNATNAHDAERLAALYSPGAQLLYSWGTLLAGRDAIAAHFSALFEAFPDWRKQPYAVFEALEDWAVVEWRAAGTFLGTFDGALPTGRQFRLRGCGVFNVLDGQIQMHRRYFDRREWYRQMGLEAA